MVQTFKDLNLSQPTQRGLDASKFTEPTPIQRTTIQLALEGSDILAAAKTGSGKTLAFLVPVLDILYKEKWNRMDGLGALIITPTRELAYQIFEVLRKVGKHHEFSAGLVIGGKDLKYESGRMNTCNIIVCTPGRLLWHMDQNPVFNWEQLRILVLDEADRILDLGFSKTMNAILQNLPNNRQTLLFSATQTKDVKDLARLSLRNPKFVDANSTSNTVTPENLKQIFIEIELHQKLDTLFSFLKSNQQKKIIVFMSTCKQVKYTCELFRLLRPPVSLLALYGSLHQLRRMSIYDEFCKNRNVCLFATDIAARGLDFPSIDWVVQLDCPEDANTYIHRVGRTARFHQNGQSVMFLIPTEKEAMLKRLAEKTIPIEEVEVNQEKMQTIKFKAKAFCARDVVLKESAQRAFIAYFKSVYLMKDKEVFNVRALNKDKYADSLGLHASPVIKFLEKKEMTSKDKPQEKEKEGKVAEKQLSLFDSKDSDNEEEDIFTVKSTWRSDDIPAPPPTETSSDLTGKKKRKIVTKATVAKKLAKKKIQLNTKIIFNDDGHPVDEEVPKKQTSDKLKDLEERNITGIDIELAKQIMRDEDVVDKRVQKIVIQEKKKKRKDREQKKKEEAAFLGDNDYDEEPLDETTEKFIDELPDPDKVFGVGGEDDSGSNRDEMSDDYDEEDGNFVKRARLASSSEESGVDDDFELPAVENLAKYLLKSK